MIGSGVTVARVGLDSAAAEELIGRLNAELSTMYPEEGSTFFDLTVDEVAVGNGMFVVAMLDGRAVGCGAVRRLSGDRAEIKRMYTDPSVRGRGIGTLVVAALEAEAKRIGVRTLVLETGVRQIAAQALYRQVGFAVCPCWGKYAEASLSVCMTKSV